MNRFCSESHLYVRELDPQGEDSLAKIARLICPNTQVLDLGTGPGVLGKYLSTALSCTVDGVEFSPEQAQLAKPFYRDLRIADLEKVDLTALFPDRFAGSESGDPKDARRGHAKESAHQRYDYIVCADVLEHLKNPGAVVSQLPALLRSKGRIVLSIPNIAHAGVIAELLAGEFRYRPEGLLDATHLRFFTRKSLLGFLNSYDLAPLSVDTVSCDLRASEFRGYYLEALPPTIYRLLQAYPDALTYQFVVEAIPGKQALKRTETKPITPEFHFACQLYWRFGKAEYHEENSRCALGRIGAEHQLLRFSIPPMAEAPTGVRLDPADRPGFFRIHRISLCNNEEQCIWEWEGNVSHLQVAEIHQMELASTLITAFGVNVLLTGEDPYIELPLEDKHLAPLKEGGVLKLEVSWPMSADYMVLAQCVEQKDNEITQRNKLITLRDQEIQARDSLLREKKEIVELRDKQLQEKDKIFEELKQQTFEELKQQTFEELKQQKKEQEQLLAIKDKELRELDRVIGEQKNGLNVYEKQLMKYNNLVHALEMRLTYQDSWRGWVRRPFRPLRRWYLKLFKNLDQ